ncbi:YhhA family cyclophane-containing RiPP [Nitrosospira sp. NRS527]|uniref:YhhA family cyclophane-containing RiPP n=1 Tax=Nitrosospira sp. NRS527 TaxID=155925 RepID=UPI001AF60524|nr:YhhA family cyclophane-containing RiPP [Nitrosospira sp. NRS527]BCT69467.1 hypothetical protein NNRS527_03091 [Nitrosospira sp. NRS527]
MPELAQPGRAEAIDKIDQMEFLLKNISSPVLARLIQEVKNEERSTTQAYDRVHNRHNR